METRNRSALRAICNCVYPSSLALDPYPIPLPAKERAVRAERVQARVMSGVNPNEIRSKPQAYLHPLSSYYSRVLLPSRLFRGASSFWYWLLIFLLLNIASLASAHTVGISRGEYRLHSMDVTADLTFARP